MKKFLSFIIVFLCIGAIFAQEEVFVSTTPGKKKCGVGIVHGHALPILSVCS